MSRETAELLALLSPVQRERLDRIRLLKAGSAGPRYTYRRAVSPVQLPLTLRQTEVLIKLGEGLTQPQVALQTGMSVETVRTHTREARRRLGARTNSQAYAVAYRAGLI